MIITTTLEFEDTIGSLSQLRTISLQTMTRDGRHAITCGAQRIELIPPGVLARLSLAIAAHLSGKISMIGDTVDTTIEPANMNDDKNLDKPGAGGAGNAPAESGGAA